MTYLLCDCQLITCNHLNTNSKVKCPVDGLNTIMSWRIKQGKQPTKCPRTSRTFFSLICSRASLLARIQLVIAVRLSTGLKGRKCISMMFARASFSN
ncbi:unnamed protein product, partial [Vitis vinifera]|uniref:Uncharacterized protein n=1 Tax=Vitis vinifera TaxID=29760 RepID=D7U5W4_VITVI